MSEPLDRSVDPGCEEKKRPRLMERAKTRAMGHPHLAAPALDRATGRDCPRSGRPAPQRAIGRECHPDGQQDQPGQYRTDHQRSGGTRNWSSA